MISMTVSLPTTSELAKLPMRAIVAYAARSARRIGAALQGVIADDVLNDALRLIDSVATTEEIRELDQVALIEAAERVAKAYEDAPTDEKSPAKFYLVFAFIFAALAAMHAIQAAVNPERAAHEMKKAVSAAERAVRPVGTLGEGIARVAIEAARQDYERLLTIYGKQDEVVIGKPLDCFGP